MLPGIVRTIVMNMNVATLTSSALDRGTLASILGFSVAWEERQAATNNKRAERAVAVARAARAVVSVAEEELTVPLSTLGTIAAVSASGAETASDAGGGGPGYGRNGGAGASLAAMGEEAETAPSIRIPARCCLGTARGLTSLRAAPHESEGGPSQEAPLPVAEHADLPKELWGLIMDHMACSR